MEGKSHGSFVIWSLNSSTICPSKIVITPLLESGFYDCLKIEYGRSDSVSISGPRP